MIAKALQRVVIADDHCVVRDLFKFQLGRLEPRRYEIVGEAATGPEAIGVCLETRPDLVLMDMMMPGLNGVEVMRRVRPEMPRVQILFFSGSTREPMISEALAHGASGFVGKARPWQTVLEAIELVAQGGKYYDPAVAHLVDTRLRELNNEGFEHLTAREREVAQLIAEGGSTKEIASRLGVSAKTIDKHRTRMMEKLRLHDAVAVTRYAIRAGMVSVD